jgi:1-acyl-sn-glycerol-3-phosphate acyltransferase
MRAIGSLLFTVFLFVSTLVFAVIVLLCAWRPFNTRYAVARAWARTNLTALKWLCGLDYQVEGQELLPPGQHISLWKHSSAFETLAQALVFPPQSWVLKRELMWIPVVGWATHFMRPIAIDRRAGAAAVNQVIEQGTERLNSGLWVLVFPEGTRVPVGTTRRFGVSAGLLAASTGRCLVPVAHDAGLYWPRRGLLKRPGKIRIVIGPPIAGAGRDAREINDQAKAWIDAKVAELGA